MADTVRITIRLPAEMRKRMSEARGGLDEGEFIRRAIAKALKIRPPEMGYGLRAADNEARQRVTAAGNEGRRKKREA
jgi:hypothetical protein